MLIEQIAEALSVELEKVTVGRRLAGLSNQVERHAGQVHSVLVPVLGSLRRQRPRNCGVLALPSISSSKGSHSARLAAFFPKGANSEKKSYPESKVMDHASSFCRSTSWRLFIARGLQAGPSSLECE